MPHPAPRIEIPANALVVLVGASASGKSSWAQCWFRSTQTVSSDRCRALVSDDESDQTVNTEAFAVFYEIVRRRLQLGKLTVADSTALTPRPREHLLLLAEQAAAPAVAVVICTPTDALVRHNQARRRRVPEDVLVRHARQLHLLIESGSLEREGFAAVRYLHFPELAVPMIVPPVFRAPPPSGRGNVPASP